MVAREHEHIFGVISLDEVDILIDGVRRALIPLGALYLLIGGEDVDSAVCAVEIPRLAVADVVVQLKRLILCEHADGVDAGVDAVGKRKVDYAVFAAVGNGGFSYFFW